MSHVMDNELTILKRDARGRVRSTVEARAEAVVEYRRSGLSASAFAKMAGISKNTSGMTAQKNLASSASPGVLEAEIEKRGKDTQKIKPRKEREARVPEHLPAVDEVIEPEKVAAAPAAWRHIGEEVTEQLDYEPARFLRRRIIRRKYVKRDEPHQDCSRRSSSPNTAIICLSTGRSRSTPHGTTSPSHAKAWHAGSGSPPIGCARFMSTSTPE